MVKKKNLLVVGGHNPALIAQLLAIEIFEGSGFEVEEASFDEAARMLEEVQDLEIKDLNREVPAHCKTRRNKSDRKRNKRQRWK